MAGYWQANLLNTLAGPPRLNALDEDAQPYFWCNNAFWYLASEKLVTQTEGAQAGSGSLPPPPQAVSVTARMAALDMGVQKKTRILFGMVMILLRLKVSRLNIVAPYDGIKSVNNKKQAAR